MSLRKYCEACGVKYRSSHKILFYNCSKMYEKGVPEKTNQKLMGHSSLKMTRHYDRRIAKDIDEEMIDELFGYELPVAAGSESQLYLLPSTAQQNQQ